MNFFHGSGCPNAPVAVPTMPRYPFEKPPLMFGPNIIGTANGIFGLTGTEIAGAITKEITGRNLAGYNGSGAQYGEILFDASLSSSVFGTAETVQPPTLLGLACIKI